LRDTLLFAIASFFSQIRKTRRIQVYHRKISVSRAGMSVTARPAMLAEGRPFVAALQA
jgi:hypothetical protein